MYFSWYFIALLFGITILSNFIAAGWFLWYALIVLIAFWAIDGQLIKGKMKISVERQLVNPAYQNQKTQVKLTFTNSSAYDIRVDWKDEPPFAVQAPHPQGSLYLRTGEPVTACYDILPPKRGQFQFGALNMRSNGWLWLFTRQFKYSLPAELIVYPDLSKISTAKLARLAASQTEGPHRRRMLGMGGELAQLREFVRGDDYRKINWKVTAHRGKPIVNEFEPEKDQSVFLLFDSGRLLFDQVNSENSRYDHILDSAILLALQVLQRGDLIGALSFNCKVQKFLPAGKGNHHLQLFIRTFYDEQAQMVESDYREAFRFWQNKVTKRSLLFVYTDLLDKESSCELCSHLQIISRHHLVVCVLAQQHNLLETLELPITDEKSAYLKGTALELLEERGNLKRSLANYGVKILEVNPLNIRQTVVEHYLSLKERGVF